MRIIKKIISISLATMFFISNIGVLNQRVFAKTDYRELRRRDYTYLERIPKSDIEKMQKVIYSFDEGYHEYDIGNENIYMVVEKYIPQGLNYVNTYEYIKDYEGKASYRFTYEFPKDHLEKAEKHIDTIINSMPKGLTDIQKLAYLYLQIESMRYTPILKEDFLNPKGIYANSPYAVFNGGAACGGFAHAFTIAANKLGFNCRYVSTHSSEGDDPDGHAWAIVKLGDNWYGIDPVGYQYEYSEYAKYGIKYGFERFMFGYENVKARHMEYNETIYPTLSRKGYKEDPKLKKEMNEFFNKARIRYPIKEVKEHNEKNLPLKVFSGKK